MLICLSAHVCVLSRSEQVFEEVKDLVTSVLDGFNVCIFAYVRCSAGHGGWHHRVTWHDELGYDMRYVMCMAHHVLT